jgi:hypothetical protein
MRCWRARRWAARRRRSLSRRTCASPSTGSSRGSSRRPLPPSKKHWTADDAVGIWCLKCHKALVFQKGSSQSIRYHMETKHRVELEAFRDHGKVRWYACVEKG